MNYSEERYVKVYTRNTPRWTRLPWQAKCVLLLLLRTLDKRGELDLGDGWADALPTFLGLPPDVVGAGMPVLLSIGTLEMRGTTLVMPKFREAQEAVQIPALRQEVHRERESARRVKVAEYKESEQIESQKQEDCHAPSHAVTGGHTPSQPVTESHAPSHAVTASHSIPAIPAIPAIPDMERESAPAPPSLPPELESGTHPIMPKAAKAGRKRAATGLPSVEATSTWLGQWGLVEASQEPAFAHFVDHHRARGNVFADWAAAWRTWKRNEVKFGGGQRGSPIVQSVPVTGFAWKVGNGE